MFLGKPPRENYFSGPLVPEGPGPPGDQNCPQSALSREADLPSTMYWAGAGTPGDPRGLGPPRNMYFPGGGFPGISPGQKKKFALRQLSEQKVQVVQ